MESACPVKDGGIEAISWIYNIFGDCVYGWQESLSLLLGYLSILCWLNAQMPQVIKNYKLRDAESLSFSFLAVWLVADIANFIGCIITHQLPFQIVLAVYFTMVDGALCVQWLYYVKHRNNFVRRWIDGKSNIALEEEDEDDKLIKEQRFIKDLPAIEASSSSSGKELVNEEESLLGTSQGVNSKKNYSTMYFIFTFVSFGLTSSSTTLFTEPNLDSYNNNLINNLIVDIAQAKDNTIWVGRFFAWVCAILYLASRVPQLYRNARRRSVEGLSMALFFFAFMGNFTYMLGIFANPHATRASMLEAVPYILGSGGTLIFDGAIFVQYAIFNSKYSGVAIEHA